MKGHIAYDEFEPLLIAVAMQASFVVPIMVDRVFLSVVSQSSHQELNS